MAGMPQGLIIGLPQASTLCTQLFSVRYKAIFISKEQYEKHLCNPSSHYGEYTRETRAPYLDT